MVLGALLISLSLPAVPAPIAGTSPARAAGPAGAVVYLPIAAPAPRTLAPPRFGAGHGFYDRPFRLVLTSESAGAVIRYTLDGRPPLPGIGEVYTAPIPISTTTLVRAAAYRPGLLPSAVATQTFIFPADVLRQPDLPAGFPPTWGVPPEDPARGPVAADYGMDPDVVGDPRYRDRLKGDLMAIPSVSVVTAPDDMFGAAAGLYSHPDGRGADWERPASVELIQADGAPGFQADCGVRIAGVASRKHGHTLKKSLSLRFRSRYGATRLDYPLFPGGGVMSFDALRLRAGFNDSFPYLPERGQYIRDEWGRRTQREMGWTSARGIFVHLYLNGLYWGLYNLTEEPAGAFAADHLGGEEEDYDVVESTARGESGVIDGDRIAYQQLIAMDRFDEPIQYAKASVMLNIPQHIDFLLTEIYGANQDWPLNNWRALRNRVTGGGFQFLVWDFEVTHDLLPPDHGLYNAQRADNLAATFGVDELHRKLLQNVEYRMLFADRVRRHFTGGGALTAQRSRARYAALAAEVDRAIVAESARWGDAAVGPYAQSDGGRAWSRYWAANGPGHPQTRDEQWRPERDRLLDTWFPGRTRVVMDQLCPLALYPPVAAPRIDPPGGAVEPGMKLGLAGGSEGCPGARSDGTIYYTLDGSDPREAGSGTPGRPWSGRVAPVARVYRGAITLPGARQVKARSAVVDNGALVWSALSEVTFGSPRLAWSEVMYHPPDPDAEFVELVNLGDAPADLSGMTTDGISFTFPPAARLAPGAYAVLVKDAAVFRSQHLGVRVDGVYQGRLANEGETLALHDPTGQVMAAVSYDDEGYWPLGPDGYGYALVPLDPAAAPGDPERWRASAEQGGSPGRADPPPPYGRVVPSEVLASSDPPYEDAIELANPGADPVDIGGWFLSDDRDDLRKFRIPDGTVVGPGGFAVFYEQALRIGLPLGAPADSGPGSLGSGFALSAAGESVYLSSADRASRLTGSIQGISFGASPSGVSFGRVTTRAGPDFALQAEPTFGVANPPSVQDFRAGQGAPNAGPRIGPVVISELMYDPPVGGDEYIELHNRTAERIPLFEDGPPDRPAGAWRFTAGIDFSFPAGAAIPPEGYALVVPIDPELFRIKQRIPPAVPIYGPYAGQLDNTGEVLALSQPVEIDGELRAIEVDRVRYDDASPWHAAAAGSGPALERIAADRFGNDPDNWSALHPEGTPGGANTVPVVAWLPVAWQGRAAGE